MTHAIPTRQRFPQSFHIGTPASSPVSGSLFFIRCMISRSARSRNTPGLTTARSRDRTGLACWPPSIDSRRCRSLLTQEFSCYDYPMVQVMVNRAQRVTVNPEHAGQGFGGAVRLATRPGAKAEARRWNLLSSSAKVMLNGFVFYSKPCAPGASFALSAQSERAIKALPDRRG